MITAQAYELAKADATRLLDAARKQGLDAAAAAKVSVVHVGPLTNRSGQAIPGLALPAGPAANDFVGGAFDLLSVPTSRPSGKPVALIPLPRDGRVVVAELGNVDATWTAHSLPIEQARYQAVLTQKMQDDFVRWWFDYPSLQSRLGFTPEPAFKDNETTSGPPPEQPSAPLF